MRHHIKREHRGKYWECKICDRRYLGKADCKEHISQTHAVQKDREKYVQHIKEGSRSPTPEELTSPAAAERHLQQYPVIEEDDIVVIDDPSRVTTPPGLKALLDGVPRTKV